MDFGPILLMGAGGSQKKCSGPVFGQYLKYINRLGVLWKTLVTRPAPWYRTFSYFEGPATKMPVRYHVVPLRFVDSHGSSQMCFDSRTFFIDFRSFH